MYIYNNQVVGIQHVFFFIFKELVKMNKSVNHFYLTFRHVSFYK